MGIEIVLVRCLVGFIWCVEHVWSRISYAHRRTVASIWIDELIGCRVFILQVAGIAV